MTRPGGTTPRGLPYPGSAGIHANTPAALQALAEAVTAQLTSLGNDIVLETFTGTITTESFDRGYGVAAFTVPWKTLGTVLGMVASYGNFAGGPGTPGWIHAPDTGSGLFFLVPAKGWVAPYTDKFVGVTVSLCALGWGYPV